MSYNSQTNWSYVHYLLTVTNKNVSIVYQFSASIKVYHLADVTKQTLGKPRWLALVLTFNFPVYFWTFVFKFGNVLCEEVFRRKITLGKKNIKHQLHNQCKTICTNEREMIHISLESLSKWQINGFTCLGAAASWHFWCVQLQ